MNKKDKFIEKSVKTHGDKYDYTLVKYENNKIKVKIYCKKCKIFFYQRPYNHYGGCGCPSCAGNKKINNDTFIIKAKERHGDLFDYSLIEYKNMHTAVKIICPIHGLFTQTPMNHLKYGCICCSERKLSNSDEFIQKSKLINGDKYDYSLVDYKKSNIKVKIRCIEHNYIFEQTPNNHLSKNHGCPICGNRKRRLKRIEEISKNKFNGEQIIPSFNKEACKIFDEISLKENIHIQHAMNGGEYYIKELGYWVDGYDKKNNVVYEFDEEFHKYQIEKDINRQQEIENFLKCKFIRLKTNYR
jgi:hypothetical protein